jgi:hypothetical protein
MKMGIMKKIIMVAVIAGILTIGLYFAINRQVAVAQTPTEPTYVPGSKCKTCHIKQFKAHALTPHGTAFENIKDAGEETNPTCLQCHSTGYGKPGGFADAQSTADLAGVTCQACHGPGSDHIAAPKEQKKQTIHKATSETCVSCHKIHGDHPELGVKELPYLKNKLEKLQNQIKEMEGK